MNRNRQLSNVYWRNAKPYLNWQSTQPSINSTSKWMSFKSNTGNFTFQREPGWMQRPVAVWLCLRGRTLTQFPTIPCNLQMANWSDSISQTGQCKTRTAECEQQTECKKSAVFILHFAPSLRFTHSLQSAFYPWSPVCVLHWPSPQTLPESNWTHTNPVYLTFTWENRKFQLKKIKWFAIFRLRSFIKKGLWTEAVQFFYSV